MDQQTPVDQQKRTIEWLNRLIMLAQRHRRLPFHAVRLLSDPIEYEGFLTQVRASATDKAQLTDSSTENTPVVVARKKLLEAVATVPAIQDLFGSDQDPFKGASADYLELLAEVSDVVADSQKMVYSRNGTLVAVIEAMRQDQELDPAPLIIEWLKRFLMLWETEPPAENEKSTAELLYDLAISPNWYIVMASLIADRDYARDEEPAVADTLKLWKGKIEKPTIQKLLLKPGHLSRAPKKLICLVWEHRDLFAEARTKIPENAREKNPDDERKQVADSAFLLFEEKFKTAIDAIKADLKLLAMVGTHFVNVRKFAKFDGFVYTWPKIAELGRANYRALKYVEGLVLSRAPKPTEADLDAQEAGELYSLIEKNERLKGFLRLRPYFREINENDLMQYRPLAPVVLTTSSRPGTGIPESVNFVAQQPSAPAPPPTKVLEVQTLSLVRSPDVGPSEQVLIYDISLAMLGKTTKRTVTFNVEKLLDRILSAMGVSSDSGLQEILKELFVSDPSFAEERIRRGSLELVGSLLPGVGPLAETVATPPSLRLVVNSSEREIHYLPWEWWPTSMSTLLLTNSDQSVVRSFKSPTEDVPSPMFAPLRLMSVIPNPQEGIRFTSDMTLKALEELGLAQNVQYRPVVREEATLGNLERHLEDFKPHIVHFEGNWIIGYRQLTADDESHYEGMQMILSDKFLGIGVLSPLLKKSGVQLVVIGRNGLSRIYESACATAAYELAKQGIAVIAPMRGIDDTSATTFTTELYRAFLQGNKLEQALHLARRDLASKGGDWTVFALFADPTRLDDFQLLRESA